MPVDNRRLRGSGAGHDMDPLATPSCQSNATFLGRTWRAHEPPGVRSNFGLAQRADDGRVACNSMRSNRPTRRPEKVIPPHLWKLAPGSAWPVYLWRNLESTTVAGELPTYATVTPGADDGPGLP
jgi:hypothetical protein